MITRFILVRRGCAHCLQAIKAVNLVNRHLPDQKQIQVKDNYEWEEFGFKAHPIIDTLDPKTFEGYPYIFIDGVEVEPGDIPNMAIVIAKLIEEDLIFPLKIGQIAIG